jgi:hypothetical protein
MFISIETNRRVNPFATYRDSEGTTYPRMPEHLYQEIMEPFPPEDYTDETYYRTEQDSSPYVVFTRKSDDQLRELGNSKIKSQIAAIEAGQARAVREAALGDPNYLTQLEAQIQALREQLIPEPAEPEAP